MILPYKNCTHVRKGEWAMSNSRCQRSCLINWNPVDPSPLSFSIFLPEIFLSFRTPKPSAIFMTFNILCQTMELGFYWAHKLDILQQFLSWPENCLLTRFFRKENITLVNMQTMLVSRVFFFSSSVLVEMGLFMATEVSL